MLLGGVASRGRPSTPFAHVARPLTLLSRSGGAVQLDSAAGSALKTTEGQRCAASSWQLPPASLN